MSTQEEGERPKGLTAEDEAVVQFEHKKEIRQKNLDAYVSRPDPNSYKNLDGSIKKNTSFIKKIRTGLTHDQLPTLLKDVTSLKLEKYLEEVVAAIAESWTRLKTSADIWAATETVFAVPLGSALVKQLGPPPSLKDVTAEQKEREETTRLVRQRSTLRFVTELYLVAVIRDADGKEGVIPDILNKLLLTDKDALVNVSLAVAFAKYYGDQFLGKVSRKGRERSGSVSSASGQPPAAANAGHESDVPSGSELTNSAMAQESLVPLDIRTKVKAILVEYFKSVSRHLVREHQRVRNAEKRNHEHYIAKGEIYADRQEKYEKDLKYYEKLLSNTQILAEYLDQEVPPLPEDETVTRLGIGILEGGKVVQEKDTTSGPWEDEDARTFYENIPDLKTFVPAMFLGLKKPEEEVDGEGEGADAEPAESVDAINVADVTPDVPENAEQKELEDESAAMEDDTDEPEPTLDLDDDADDEEKGKPMATSDKVKLDDVLTRLPNAMNRDAIDKIAEAFAYVNSKAARNKLIRTLVEVPRQRLELLPYYGRLIATLNPYMPDIGKKIVESLERSFHYHQKRKNQVFIEEKAKNIRFIGELTKFKVVPTHVVFHCLKVLLDDFKFHNIELACNLFESCGRFLYKTPETHTRTSNFLDILNKKKANKYIDSRQALMIENAYYTCNPPERSAMATKNRTPIELYMRKLIYSDLTKKNVEKILKQFRKFNWDDTSTRRSITKLFHKIWKVKFSHLHLMAFLCSELARYYPEFGVGVVDNTLEEVRVGMEVNLFKWNQRRVATVKFLGELYNYRMVDSGVVFETLYLLIRFGHENGVPMPGVSSPIDATHDFFRVRLCCTLLDTCGQCFDRGSTAKKLDQFLVFLQMYILTKTRPPMDVDFLISETFELLRPNMRLFETYEEAVQEVNRIAMEQREAAGATGNGVVEEDSDDDEDDDEEEERGGPRRGASPFGDEDGAEESEGKMVDVESDEVVVHLPVQEADEDDGYDDEFEKEFNRVMQESLESRKHERKPGVFDVAVPRRVREQAAAAAAGGGEDGGEVGTDGEDGKVTFMLLTKKGSKQQAKTMALPADSDFVRSTRSKLEAEQEEKLQLKRLVLSYEERERDNADQEAAATNGQRVPPQGRVLWTNSASRGRGYFANRGFRGGGGYRGGGGGYGYGRGGGGGGQGSFGPRAPG
ncbi:hypothetical protein HDV00_011914 [Rhizophlyctis rosea]|nr:hypothetical protein HDV00_011914 [Rhizophlyctis rosea]